MTDPQFDFLPNLPKPDLDDRTFQELVNECLLRIPRYTPEWTHYNPSDPGITLIEMFAWLTDQMLLRFNQVPVRNYITFLELLGIQQQPPTPAKTEVTFYLTASLAGSYTIPAGIEIATERTETEEAIIFTTDTSLTITQATLKHCLTTSAEYPEAPPYDLNEDHFALSFNTNETGEWENTQGGLNIFQEPPQEKDCFYLVFDDREAIAGNIIALKIRGEGATSTGINPQKPPRIWEAWTGKAWESVLRQESNDSTEGFSFSTFGKEGGDSLTEGAEIILHLPLDWPSFNFETFAGQWLRCRYLKSDPNQPGYDRPPRMIGIQVRTLGGTTTVTQSAVVRDEILGESDGNPGQSFYLQQTPILPREQQTEYLEITPIAGKPEMWQEVENFSQSSENDRHYTLDSITGRVQFGPLIREKGQLRDLTHTRERLQRLKPAENGWDDALSQQWQSLQRQCGKVPPRGAMIRMVSYRTGGGQRGNVHSGTIRILKTAIPYIANVINYKPARGGTDVEPLEAAVLRVPRLLRTRERAVTAEDFETLALQGSEGAIARAKCLPPKTAQEAGIVRLLLVPQASLEGIEKGEGIDPDQFNLTESLLEKVRNYLDERRLLGVQVIYQQPRYLGVSVALEVKLEPRYNNPKAKEEIETSLEVTLYRFLNPLTGGNNGQGWPFGRPIYSSEIARIFQSIPGILRTNIQLFVITRSQSGEWEQERVEEIELQEDQLICSWLDERRGFGHQVRFIELE
jgi:predicted phage baseplate assembly protein